MPSCAWRAALRALEGERARDDADGERADLVLGDLGDHGRGARAGAAALAGGDEHHVRALERLLDVVARLGRGALADLRVRARAETLGEGRADMQLQVGVRHLERLRVGVGRDELNAGQTGVDHPVHGIGSTAADSDDFDDCEITAGFHVGFPSGPLVRVERFSRLVGGADYRKVRGFRSRCQRERIHARIVAELPKSRLRVESRAILSLRLSVRVGRRCGDRREAACGHATRDRGGRDRSAPRAEISASTRAAAAHFLSASSPAPKISSGPSSSVDDHAALVDLELVRCGRAARSGAALATASALRILRSSTRAPAGSGVRA